MSIKRLFDIARFVNNTHPTAIMFATKYNGKWEYLSSQGFINLGNAFSRGLLKLGVKPGDKIATITNNSRNEWSVTDFGILQIGAVNVPIYPSISVEDYKYIFNNAEIKCCFVSDEALFEKVKSIKSEVPSLQVIFTFDQVEKAANWSEILDLGKDKATQGEVDDLARSISPDDLATIIYTSGTTGQPKGVMLSHNNIISNILICDKTRIPRKKKLERKDTKVLSFLPICHIFERMLIYLFQYNGFSIYYAESIEKMSENLREVRPHYMTVVPRLLEKVYDKIYDKGINSGGIKSKIFLWAMGIGKSKKEIRKPHGLFEIIADKLVFSKWREGLGNNIVTLVSGSAALSPRLNKIFQNAGIPILEGYGLTETSPVISVNSFGKMKLNTVGQPLENIDVKIQPDGEISVKGPSVFKSYFNNEEATREAFTEDGYFKTGDIGYIDEEGFLHITDRKKEMFKTSGGKYIAPQIIENMAKASKFIEQIMVVGEGEKMPCAFVQPNFEFLKKWATRKGYHIGEDTQSIAKHPNVKARLEQEIHYLNSKLGNWEQIKKITVMPNVWSIEGGELTPTLKLKRKAIKDKYINLYNEMYGHNE